MINVGAATETEMKEKKARVEDALHATRAAVEEGIVPGGGVAYIRSLKVLEKLNTELEQDDEKQGVNIVRRALEQPLRTLCQNAGIEGSLIVEHVKAKEKENKNIGFDVDSEKYVDMFERLKKETPATAADPLPGWFDRRRQGVPPAEEVLATLPSEGRLRCVAAFGGTAVGTAALIFGITAGVGAGWRFDALDMDGPARIWRSRRAASACNVNRDGNADCCPETLHHEVPFAIVIVNRAPPSGRFSTRTAPPCSSTRCLTIARPRPVPPGSRVRDLSTR